MSPGRPLALLATCLVMAACGDGAPPSAAPAAGEAPPSDPFVDATLATGLDFVHDNGMSGKMYFVEPVGAGVALLDYDGDGDLDAYLVQGTPLTPAGLRAPAADRLFRNDLGPGGTVRWTDVTPVAGLVPRGYGMGVAVGDVHNDGCPDLLRTAFGPDGFWRNRCDGTFEPAAPAVADPRWSTSAAFFDLEGDGWLDLYLASYVRFSLDSHKQCYADNGRPDFCGPHSFEPETDRVWRNVGGELVDASGASGAERRASSGLGVVTADLDGDGRIDVYVANDLRPNFQLMNRQEGLVDEALLAGTAVSSLGAAEASMGVEAGDVDEDGDPDLFLTHLTGETNTLYENRGGGVFSDASARSGLGPPSREATGFGTALVDYDLDGWLDVVAVNGAVKTIEALARAGDPYPLHQPNQLFRNRGDGSFAEVTDRAGEAFEASEVSRGLAVGDVDGDGDEDLLLSNNRGPARYLRNEAAPVAGWTGVRVLRLPGGRDSLGAEVRFRLSGGVRLRRVATDGSYLSSRDPRVVLGLGDGPSPAAVEVEWPEGDRVRFLDPPRDRYLVLGREVATGPGFAATTVSR